MGRSDKKKDEDARRGGDMYKVRGAGPGGIVWGRTAGGATRSNTEDQDATDTRRDSQHGKSINAKLAKTYAKTKTHTGNLTKTHTGNLAKHLNKVVIRTLNGKQAKDLDGVLTKNHTGNLNRTLTGERHRRHTVYKVYLKQGTGQGTPRARDRAREAAGSKAGTRIRTGYQDQDGIGDQTTGDQMTGDQMTGDQ